MKKRVNKRFTYTIISAFLILLGTAFAIQYANGGLRISDGSIIQGTGLLAANSFPAAAELLIDGKLITATDDTVYLEPGDYDIEVIKNGYTPWKKKINIKEGIVVQTNATLFPKAPSLNTLTFSGASNVTPSPDGQKLIFYSNSNSSDRKNGLYILELNNNPLSFQNEPKQITDNSNNFNLTDAKFIWSPDSSEVMLLSGNREVLLNISRMNTLDTLKDISFTKKQLLSEWEQEMYLRERENYSKFPEEIISMATQSAKNVYVSPDKERIIYTATQEFTLLEDLVPAIPSRSSQPEERTVSVNGIYVYDREEDRNFRVGTAVTPDQKSKALLANDLLDKKSPLIDASTSAFSTLQASMSAETADNFNRYHSSLFTDTLQWFPNSNHLIYVTDGNINLMEYDGTNHTTIYSGPFSNEFVYPWPNGDRLIISTSFSPDVPENLYAIELKK